MKRTFSRKIIRRAVGIYSILLGLGFVLGLLNYIIE